MVVAGPRGCGKSTLVARVAQCCSSWASAGGGANAGSSSTPPGAPVLAVRFCGVSADSMTLERVLASLGQQCQLLSDGGLCWASHVSNHTAGPARLKKFKLSLARRLSLTEHCATLRPADRG